MTYSIRRILLFSRRTDYEMGKVLGDGSEIVVKMPELFGSNYFIEQV